MALLTALCTAAIAFAGPSAAAGAPAASPACATGYGQAGTGGSPQASTAGGNGCVVAEYVVGGVTYFETFNYTGALQSWFVPAGAETVKFTTYGAGGGGTNIVTPTTNGTGGSWYSGLANEGPLPVARNGGVGGSATATFVVTPGETIDVLVGQGGIGNPNTRCLPTNTQDPAQPWLDLYPSPGRDTLLNKARESFGGGGYASTHYNTRAFFPVRTNAVPTARDHDECFNPYFASGGGRSQVARGSTRLVAAGGGGGAGFFGAGGAGATLASGNASATGGNGTGPASVSNHPTPITVTPSFGAGGTGSAGGVRGLAGDLLDNYTGDWRINFPPFTLWRIVSFNGRSNTGGDAAEGGGGGGGCFGGGGGGDGGGGGGGGSSCLVRATLTRFTTTTTDGTYHPGDSINVTATMSKPIADGAQITVTLDTGETVLLTKTGPYTLSGTYVVGANATSGDLTVTSYALTTPPVDADGLTVTSTTVPSGSMNIAGAHAIVIAPAVAPVAPVAVGDAASTPPNTAVTVDVIGNDASNTGVALDPTLVRLLGPGGTPTTSVTVTGEGTYTVNATTGAIMFTPVDGFVGTSTVTYQITNSAGQTATAALTVTVAAAAAPVAVADTASTPIGTPVTVDVLANDASGTGVALDPALVRLVGPDGSAATTVTVPGEGTFTVNTTTGAITFTPVDGFVGTSTATYRITNSAGQTATAGLTVTVGGSSLRATRPTTRIAITTTASQSRVRTSQTTVITLRVRNLGAKAARSTTAWVPIPQGFAVVQRNGGTVRGRSIRFTLGDIPVGASRVRTFTLVATRVSAGQAVPIMGRSAGANVRPVKDATMIRVVDGPMSVAAVTG